MASTIIISLLLLVSLLPNLIFTAHVGIVNGTEVKPHSRPYMVSVQMNWLHICGGFLVSDQFVLTAAHCHQYSYHILTIVVGAHDLTNRTEGFKRIGVKSYHKHPGFSEDPVRNDIMLLRLDQRIIKNAKISWIPIPTKEADVKANTVCSVAGWGRLGENARPSHRLMETEVKIMGSAKCKEKWGEGNFLPSQMMCTYGHGGNCDGDSGGPLVWGKTAVGITSYGDQDYCNSPERPEVYMKVSAYLPWIHKYIGSVY